MLLQLSVLVKRKLSDVASLSLFVGLNNENLRKGNVLYLIVFIHLIYVINVLKAVDSKCSAV